MCLRLGLFSVSGLVCTYQKYEQPLQSPNGYLLPEVWQKQIPQVQIIFACSLVNSAKISRSAHSIVFVAKLNHRISSFCQN